MAGILLLRGACCSAGPSSSGDTDSCVCDGPPLGKLSGGNWMACGHASGGFDPWGWLGPGVASARRDLVMTPFAPSGAFPALQNRHRGCSVRSR